MSISQSEIEQLAAMVQLKLTAEEKAAFAADLSGLLDLCKPLLAVDLDAVEPLVYPAAGEAGARLRPDQARPGLSTQAALQNAPAIAGEFFRVPPMMVEAGAKGGTP